MSANQEATCAQNECSEDENIEIDVVKLRENKKWALLRAFKSSTIVCDGLVMSNNGQQYYQEKSYSMRLMAH